MFLLRRFLTLAAPLLIAAAGAGYLFLGPSVLFGGPTKAEIVRVTREGMIVRAASPEEDAVAQKARIAPQGYCSAAGNDAWACIVDVTLEGEMLGSFVTVLKRGTDGIWIAAD